MHMCINTHPALVIIWFRGLWSSVFVIASTLAEAMKTPFICPVVRNGTMISS